MEGQPLPTPPGGYRPRRIQLSRKRGWRLPKGAVKVDRTTMFGNLFKVGAPNVLGWGTVRDPEHAVWLHRQWLVTPSRSIAVELARHDEVLRALPSLTGHDLACWCAPDAHWCHANTLLELAARPDIAEVVVILLEGTGPWSAVERSIALGQLARLTGAEPSDVPQIGATLADLAAQVRQARTAQPEPGASS